jgi:hypothetical protein
MLCREVTPVCSEIPKKTLKHTVWAERNNFNFKPRGTYSNHWVLKC